MSSVTELAEQVRQALESGDLSAYQHLLSPRVRWGDPPWGCDNRGQVLAWYEAARARGVRARVTEVLPGARGLLVGLLVTGRGEPGDAEGPTPRWQVLVVEDGLIAEIVGFDDRDEALAAAGVSG